MSERDPAVEHGVRILSRVLFEGAYADLLFRAERRRQGQAPWLPRAEAWVRTVLEQRILLTACLEKFLSKPLQKLSPLVQANLLCAAQRLLLAKDADYAVVDQAVMQLRTPGDRWARGLTNAVLRRLAAARDSLLVEVQSTLTPAERASIPEFWEASFARVLPADEVSKALLGMRVNPGLHVQIDAATVTLLTAKGCQLTPLPPAVDCYRIQAGAQQFWAHFNDQPDAEIRIQDAGIAAWLEVNRRELQTPIWDAFCAPGGKLLSLVAAGLQVLGSDHNAKRLDLVAQASRRLGLNVDLVQMDAAQPTWEAARRFGAVIVDAPCSASGTVGRHPEVPLHVAPADLPRLAAQQKRWLQSVAAYVRPGGDLWYCTCSLFPEENEDVAAAFLAANPNWRRLPQRHPYEGQVCEVVRLWPHRHGVAGFCAQRFQRPVDAPAGA